MTAKAALSAIVLLAAATGAGAQQQEAVAYGSLPPIETTYRTRIATWAKGFFADPAALGSPLISDPVLIRDGAGRLLWLVCLEVHNAATSPPPARTERHAFGFAPNFFTGPRERLGSSLTYQTCDEHQLAWRPFRELARR